ncbi:hypothetical protein [Actinomadura rudentiformis]|uniref:hypothetical protein n=1 Tax=Actinomadura rudentiformis TaxID=359158 RepID=UPI00178C479E|nr:hypothetical protein [Actinomadura rudentiformis]
MTTLTWVKEPVGFESLRYDDRIGKLSLIRAGPPDSSAWACSFGLVRLSSSA